MALFVLVAAIQLLLFRQLNGVRLGGLASRVVLGTATAASISYAFAFGAMAEPAIRSLPQERIQTERQRWATEPREQPPEVPAASDGDGPDVAPSATSGRQHERSAASYAPKPGRGIDR